MIKKILKHLPITLFLLGIVSPGLAISPTPPKPTASEKSEPLDRTVALVGDKAITSTELKHAVAVAKAQFAQYNTALPSDNILKARILQDLINKQLLLQYAQQRGIAPTDEQIQATIEHIAKKNHWSMAEFKQQLANHHINYAQFHDHVRDEISMQQLMYTLGTSIKVSAADIKQFQKQYQAQLPIQYHVATIHIPFNASGDNPSPEELKKAEKKAEVVLQRLRAGSNFSSLMEQYPNSEDLGWRYIKQLPTVFLTPLLGLKMNQVSSPIRAENGFHIIKLLGKRSSITAADIKNRVKMEKVQKKKKKLLKTIRKQSYVKVYPL